MSSIIICCIRLLGLVWHWIKCHQVLLKSCIVIKLGTFGPNQSVFVQICAEITDRVS